MVKVRDLSPFFQSTPTPAIEKSLYINQQQIIAQTFLKYLKSPSQILSFLSNIQYFFLNYIF